MSLLGHEIFCCSVENNSPAVETKLAAVVALHVAAGALGCSPKIDARAFKDNIFLVRSFRCLAFVLLFRKLFSVMRRHNLAPHSSLSPRATRVVDV